MADLPGLARMKGSASDLLTLDRFSLRYGLVAFACALYGYLVDDLDGIYFFRELGLALGMFTVLAVAIYLIFAFLFAFFPIQPRRLASILFGPSLVCLIF